VLIPLARLRVDGEERWACLSAQRFGSQWLLLRPPAQATDGSVAGPAPWLATPLRGRLSWQARLPIGATGHVEDCALELDTSEEPADAALPGLELLVGMLAEFRRALARATVSPGKPVALLAPSLVTAELRADEAAAYAWHDPSAAEAFGAARQWPAPILALAWAAGATVTPLALLEPGDPTLKPRWRPARLGSRPARLVHLLPGLPAEDLPE
jgi:hypothetical protein